MKLAKAASQKLKGVIVEYDVLCSTLIGRDASELVRKKQEQLRMSESAAKSQQSHAKPSVGSMFVSDVRAMLKDLQQDSTGKPWVVKDRLQSALQGLPAQMVQRMTGGDDKDSPATAGRSENEIHLEKQLASASEELKRIKEQKAAALQDRLQQQGLSSGGGSSVRDKYLDKINKLKAKASVSKDPTTTSIASAIELATEATSKGLSTWLVNEGANDLMSYSELRGLFSAVIPPRSPMQEEEFQAFIKEMDGQFDSFLTKDDAAKFPDPQPLLSVINLLSLTPAEVMVIARHSETIKAAKAAGAHTVHYMPGENAIPNHSAHYHLTTLKEFQHLVEDFNGISYRNRGHVMSMF